MFDLKEFRKLNKLTQETLAGYFGVEQSFISQIETGKSQLPEVYISKILVDNKYKVPSHGMVNEERPIYGDIPLIPANAMAGYPNGDSQVLDYDVQDRYVIPEFKAKGVKYLIRASGSSMYPKYSNGDILACRPIKDTSFFQWGKVYVLDTDQGPLVKRLFECKDDPDSIECHSDNYEHYPMFRLKRSCIWSVAIVIGVIRLE